MDNNKTTVTAKEIVAVLLSHVLENHTDMTYGDLSRAIVQTFHHGVPMWHIMSKSLGEIEEACKTLNLPSLPVMVIDEATKRPAKIWYDKFDALYPDLAGLTSNKKRDTAKEKVLSCSDWSKLYNYYNSDEVTPSPQATEDLKFQRYVEGAKTSSEQLSLEAAKNMSARKRCLEIKGTACSICGFDSEKLYGIPGIIEVHHLSPSPDGEEPAANPITDLIPVCPNCHRIIHSKESGIYTPQEVKAMLGAK